MNKEELTTLLTPQGTWALLLVLLSEVESSAKREKEIWQRSDEQHGALTQKKTAGRLCLFCLWVKIIW